MFDNKPIERVISSEYNVREGKITLNCFAPNDGVNDLRTVIAGWKTYESLEDSRTKSLGGSTNLQTSRTRTYLLTNALQNFEAVLSNVNHNLDQFFNDPDYPLLLFDLEFTVGNVLFYDLYGKKYVPDSEYDNLYYYEYLDEPLNGSNILGDIIGGVTITENDPVTHVHIYGYSMGLPSWVEVNGTRKYWHYTNEDGVEKLIFDIPPNTRQINIKSPNYHIPSGRYKGSVIRGISTFPNENIDLWNIIYEGV